MHNIYELQSQNGELMNSMKHIQKLNEHMVEAEKVLLSCKEEKINWQAQLQQAQADRKVMETVRSREGDMNSYLSERLAQAVKKRELAEKREHEYTFRMWGPYKSAYQNDVILAKEQVKRYMAEEESLRQQMFQVAESNDKALLRSCDKQIILEIVKAEKTIEQVDDRIKKAQENVEKIELSIRKTKGLIARALKKHGETNVDTFFETMDAMSDAGKSASTMAGGGKVCTSGWIKDLNLIGLLLNKIGRAKTLEEQLKAFKALKGYTSKEDNLLCQMLTFAEPVIDLGHPNVKLQINADRMMPLIDIDGDSEIAADLPMPELEEIPMAVVSEADIAAEVEAREVEARELAAIAVQLEGRGEVEAEVVPVEVEAEVVPVEAEVVPEANVQLPQSAGGYSDEVFVDDMAAEFED